MITDPVFAELLCAHIDQPSNATELALYQYIHDLKNPLCGVCAGTGTPVSKKPCICGGTGLERDELRGLRNLAADQAEVLRLVEQEAHTSQAEVLMRMKDGTVASNRFQRILNLVRTFFSEGRTNPNLWRTVVRFVAATEQHVILVLPGWKPQEEIVIARALLPDVVQEHLNAAAGHEGPLHMHAHVNLGAEDWTDLRLLAPTAAWE